jgi:GT2 family glycosyltransferase
MKVLIRPTFEKTEAGDGGIRRVVEAQYKYLPQYGVTVVENEKDADIVALHATAVETTIKPIVAHCHGLYWSDYKWPAGYLQVNAQVIATMRKAEAITAPSKWVADSLRRGLWANPTVIYHGVELDDWVPAESKGYVLWNKTRVDSVCDPSAMQTLAKMALTTSFVSTFGDPAPNVILTGRTSFAAQKKIIADAGVYLATSKETCGISTLEAMAAEVPILGWDFGGQSELVEHKVTGWLAPVGDYESLLEGLYYCLENRAALGAAARAVVAEKYTWSTIMEQYAMLYESVFESANPSPKVSIIVPCYKLAHLLPDALDSVLAQPYQDWECLVMDDASPDNTKKVVASYHRKDSRIKYARNKTNEYLSTTLNHGIAITSGKYVLPLDADNMLGKNALTPLVEALDKEPALDVAYGSMQLYEGAVSSWPPAVANVKEQLKHRNQISSTAMYRKRVWQAVGGYRKRCRTADDADFWCRVLGLGFTGRKVTNDVTLVYRDRADGMSHVNKDWPWEKWYPWLDYSSPYGGKPLGPIESFSKPKISVVIPLGPGHC